MKIIISERIRTCILKIDGCSGLGTYANTPAIDFDVLKREIPSRVIWRVNGCATKIGGAAALPRTASGCILPTNRKFAIFNSPVAAEVKQLYPATKRKI